MTPRDPQVIDARTALRWLRAAQTALADAREEVDSLNVFPIPDGDTGTNMYLTMDAAVESTISLPETTTYPDALRAAARGAFLGARGNSGVIFSQMMRGLAEVLAEAPEPGAGPQELARAFRKAAVLGQASVGSPVEGTILTVMRDAATAAEVEALHPEATLASVARAAAVEADAAVTRTPRQLAALARAGVVDAGGRGLAIVLHAIDTALTGKRQPDAPSSTRFKIALPDVADELDPDGPSYEVMYLLEASDEAIPSMRAKLEPLGDSLIVVGGAGLWNVHVHVDDVGAAIEVGVEAGKPFRIRVTHFADQQQARHRQRRGTAVVSVAAGEGLAQAFKEAGAHVLHPARNVRPSTREVLDAIVATSGSAVIVLPNDRDVIPVARAAASEAEQLGIRVAVLPTMTQVQGIAALAVHEPGRGFDADVVAMTSAAGQVRHGAVTVAVRQAVTSAGICEPGDILGVVQGDFAVIGSEISDVADEVLARMLATGGELVTLVFGVDADQGWAGQLAERVQSNHPALDVVTLFGGQSRYPLLLGVE